MTTGINTNTRNKRVNAIRDDIDAGTGPGTIEIYDGTQPATGGTATTLLATGTFSDPSAPDAAGGTLTFNAITGSDAAATGTASWCRIKDSAGNFVIDMDVGVDGSGAPVIINTTSIVSGGPVVFNSAAITDGNA